MWDKVCQQNRCRRAYMSASRPTCLDGVVVLLHVYDAAK